MSVPFKVYSEEADNQRKLKVLTLEVAEKEKGFFQRLKSLNYDFYSSEII